MSYPRGPRSVHRRLHVHPVPGHGSAIVSWRRSLSGEYHVVVRREFGVQHAGGVRRSGRIRNEDSSSAGRYKETECQRDNRANPDSHQRASMVEQAAAVVGHHEQGKHDRGGAIEFRSIRRYTALYQVHRRNQRDPLAYVSLARPPCPKRFGHRIPKPQPLPDEVSIDPPAAATTPAPAQQMPSADVSQSSPDTAGGVSEMFGLMRRRSCRAGGERCSPRRVYTP